MMKKIFPKTSKKAIIFIHRFFMRKKIYFFLFFLGIIWSTPVFADLEYKISDAIAPFFDEQKEIRHYSATAFYQMDTSKPPYVDEAHLLKTFKKFQTYISRIKEAGYTHISLDDINHLITAEEYWLYADSPKLYRNVRYKQFYKKLIQEAQKNEVGVFLVTDMQFYTQEIETRFSLDPSSPELQEFNRKAFEEIFHDLPGISWVIIRIGEWGKAYDSGGYKSEVIYQTPKQVNTLLKNLLPVFEKYDKKLIFRTWTIWIGEIGNLVLDRDTYDAVFQDINSPSLIVSIKHTPWDFFAFAQDNPTIGYGKLPQIVEFQVRREYEGGWDFPNFIGELFLDVYQEISQYENVVGLWNWNQTGGWWWGHNILFNFGFNFWNEINFWTVASIMQWETDIKKSVDVSLEKLTKKYDFTKEEKTILKEIILSSRDIILTQWYIPRFIKQELFFNDIRIPTLLYIWWDRPTSSEFILSFIANTSKNIPSTQDDLTLMKKQIVIWKQVVWENQYKKDIIISLENRYRIFEILALYKQDFFSYYQWGKVLHTDIVIQKIREYQEFDEQNKIVSFDFSEVYRFYKQEKNMTQHIFSKLLLIFFVCALWVCTLWNIWKWFIKKRRYPRYFMTQKLIVPERIFPFFWYILMLILCVICVWIIYSLDEVMILKMLSFAYTHRLISWVIAVSVFLWIFISTYIFAVKVEEYLSDRYTRSGEKILFAGVYLLLVLLIVNLYIVPQIQAYFLETLPTYFYEAGSDIEKVLR